MNNLSFSLLENEEKTLIGILYNYVSFGTTLEVFGETKIENFNRVRILRTVFEKLLRKYSLIDKLSPEDFLMIGLVHLVDKKYLKMWLKNDKNKHLKLRAEYFIARSKTTKR